MRGIMHVTNRDEKPIEAATGRRRGSAIDAPRSGASLDLVLNIDMIRAGAETLKRCLEEGLAAEATAAEAYFEMLKNQ
jgi:hypothetical protein